LRRIPRYPAVTCNFVPGPRFPLCSTTAPPGFNSANSVNHLRAIPTRERSSVKRIVYSALAASAAAAVMSGCSASEIVNTGGDTKCKDFLTQDEKKQNDEVSKMLKDKSGQDPTNMEITATKASVTLYCQALGKEDTKISEAPHG
jgi:acid stress chaperone HdeA